MSAKIFRESIGTYVESEKVVAIVATAALEGVDPLPGFKKALGVKGTRECLTMALQEASPTEKDPIYQLLQRLPL